MVVQTTDSQNEQSMDRDSEVSDGKFDDIDEQSEGHLDQSNLDDSMADSDDTSDSVKILPISQEARLRQIEEIDDELTEKLWRYDEINTVH